MKKKYTVDDIQVVSTQEAIRLRPKLHFKKIFDEGNLNALPLELACYALDEYFDGNCTSIELTIYDDHFSINYDASMTLSDDPEESRVVRILTKIFACRNEKKHLAVGEKFCELGIATVNFSSEYCVVKTTWNGKKGYFRCEEGFYVEGFVEESSTSENRTEITLKPDPNIFGDLKLSYSGVQQKVDEIRTQLEGLSFVVKDGLN